MDQLFDLHMEKARKIFADVLADKQIEVYTAQIVDLSAQTQVYRAKIDDLAAQNKRLAKQVTEAKHFTETRGLLGEIALLECEAAEAGVTRTKLKRQLSDAEARIAELEGQKKARLKEAWLLDDTTVSGLVLALAHCLDKPCNHDWLGEPLRLSFDRRRELEQSVSNLFYALRNSEQNRNGEVGA